MKSKAPWSLIINNLSYIQTFILVGLIFFLSLIPLGYYWIRTHLDHIEMLDLQIQEMDHELHLKNLFSRLQQHRFLIYQSLKGNGVGLKSDLNVLQHEIDEIFQQILIQSNPDGNFENLSKLPSSYENKPNTRELYNKWHVLKQKIDYPTELPIEQSYLLHTDLIQNIQLELSYLSHKLHVMYAAASNNYFLLESIFLRFPVLQENIAHLALISGNALENHTIPAQQTDILSLIQSIQSDLQALQKRVELTSTFFAAHVNQNLTNLMQEYQRTIEEFLQLINTQLLETKDPQITGNQIIAESQNVLLRGSRVWDQGLEMMKQLFKVERSHWIYRMWIIPLLTLIIPLLAFFLGLTLTYLATSRLNYLTQATNSFTNGNLSIRVPVAYQDEIGRQSQAFNRMAQKLEEIINYLYELLDATTALSKGNLSTRILVRGHHSEFDEVAVSFNKMAETFETILGRLQQLGIILTTSAAEIAAASKEQETIIVEQGATTGEIAVAANEISSTAKEFASTMNDISRVADQTSTLALTGKESLSNMESIMKQMVEASSNIAAKLAVLNEKAGNITSVITTITKVADQTNLLSLNASIEAEKAGEYGRSFAVIAREIRRLADQTAIATLDIEKMVNEIMLAVSSSVMSVDDFTQEIRNGGDQVKSVSGQLTKIIEQVQAFTARFDMVNQGMQAQSAGAEQINEAISQLSQTAQQTTESIHQFHKTIQELNNAANELRNISPLAQFNSNKNNHPYSDNELHSATNRLKNTQQKLHPVHANDRPGT